MSKENDDLTGFWWIPSNPANKLAGIFRYSKDNGMNLNLIGSFIDEQTITDVGTKYPVIFGATNNKEITLINCSVTESSFSTSGFSSLKCRVDKVFIGAHLSFPEENLFYKVEVEYTYLTDWIGEIQFSTSNISREKYQEYQVTYHIPNAYAFVSKSACLKLNFALDGKTSLFRTNISKKITLEIEVENDLKFEEFITRFVYPLQNFLTFVTGKLNALERIDVYSRQKNTIFYQNQNISLPIQVIDNQIYHGEERKENFQLSNVLFSFQYVKDKFGEIINKWIENHEHFEATCNLYFGIQYQNQLYLEQKFLSIAQAVESFHRHSLKYKIMVLPKDEHKKKINAILSSIPEEHKDWLKQKLSFSNEPSLHDRLSELIETVKESIEPLLGDINSFIKKVKDTRNYLTHYDRSGKKKAIEGLELFWLIQGMSFLLQALFLSELEFSCEDIKIFISKDPMFTLVRDNLRTEVIELGLTQKLIKTSPLAPLPQEKRIRKNRILRPFFRKRRGWMMRRIFILRKLKE